MKISHAVALILLANTISYAQTETTQLEDVQVQGSWLGDASTQTVKKYVGSRTVLDSEYLEKTPALNLEEALRTVPGIQIQDETGTGVLPNISVRGLKPGRSDYLNALVNGIPATLAPYSHSSLSLFPVTMDTVEKIDIVRGGAAVHYGPNNVGGVINFITKPITNEVKTTLKETLTTSDEGNLLTDTYLRTGGFVKDDLGLQLQYNGINGDSYRDHSDTDIKNVILDAEYYPTDNSSLKSTLQYYKANADLPGALLPEAYDKDKSKSQRKNDNFEGSTKRASLTYTLNPTNNTEFSLINFVQSSKRKFSWGWNDAQNKGFTPLTEDSIRAADRKIDVYGIEPRFTYATQNQKITVGARYVNEDVDYFLYQTKFNDNIKNTVRDWKIKTSAYAGYISDTISLMNGDFTITPGLRLEKVKMKFNDNINDNNKNKRMSEYLPGLSVGYQATNELFLFTNAQKSLKTPQVAQVTKEGELKPELAWNYEIGARYIPNDIFSATTTLYRIDYDNQIEYVRAEDEFKNYKKTLHQGIETLLSLKATDHTKFTLGYTYLDTEQKSGENEGKKLPWVSKHQFSLATDYSASNYDLNLTGIYLSKTFSDTANTKKENITGSTGENPAYMLWNTKISTKVKINDKLNAKFSFGINNLFDKDYYFRGVDISPVGRIPGQGRTYRVMAQFDF